MTDLYKKLVVISSPSGGGKGTLVSKLLQNNEDIWVSISATSRKPRGSERHGKEYYFLSRDDFLTDIENEQFLEYAEFSGNLYGTPRKYIDEHLNKGEIVILEIEVQGAFQIRDKCPGCNLVFIEPPSLEVLESRLRGRGTDSEESISKRLEAAKFELEQSQGYDKIIVNDNLDVAFCELNEYINRLR
jgi:guanylate kinase